VVWERTQPAIQEMVDSTPKAKQYYRLRRFRLRGLKKVNIEGVLVAAGQNIKRLIKQDSTELFSFYKWRYLLVTFPHSTYFFNTLLLFATFN